MRVVAFSDTHGATDFDVPDGDVLVMAGDYCRGFNYDGEYKALNAKLSVLPHRHKLYIAGNHDVFLYENRVKAEAIFTEAEYLLDESVVIDGIKFYGSPWVPEFYSRFAFAAPRGPTGLGVKWAGIPDDTDVLITHGPCHNILDPAHPWPGAESIGCRELRKRCDVVQPKLHIFGHAHSGYGVLTSPGGPIYANVSIGGIASRRAMIFDI